ncbi:GNAT family N-acetyltransferase [Haloarculaceae archaeon H-GB11]|nr:GNAT family N-acetyltransferase [Haloarculaceae archaeon H-GB11]
MTGRAYPDEAAADFEAPPSSFEDQEGRQIDLAVATGADYEDLVEMYQAFDPEDRAQGVPPVRDEAIRDWIETLLSDECVNVVARDGAVVVGHATLVPDTPPTEDDGGDYELAIFVQHEYQGAGIGTALLKALLGRGQDEGVEKVWLTVERWNEPALALYRSVGFVTANAETFEMEMAIRLH